MIILDTDHCIEILRGNKRIITERMKRQEPIAVSWMTVGELFYGAAKSKNPSENKSIVESFLLTVDIKFPAIRTMTLFGETKATLSMNGIMIPDADLFIGITAIEADALLVTGNTVHFARISALRLENWIR